MPTVVASTLTRLVKYICRKKEITRKQQQQHNNKPLTKFTWQCN